MARKTKNNNRTLSLVVVESPAKARTIERILGSGYTVRASLGHVRDLPKKEIGIDIEKQFAPRYQVLGNKRSVIKEMKALGIEADAIYLATDPDREGEAISWHLVKAAGWDESLIRRVVFHEITKGAVEEAFNNPREIDMQLVDAQQARRILDRLVGYQLSPLLWRKVQRGLSAGRVQSVALRLAVEREEEIDAFVPREYWRIKARLKKETGKTNAFLTILQSEKGRRGGVTIPDETGARLVLRELDGASYKVGSIKKREVRQSPAPPFITSTLQQEAWRKLRFSASRTMSLAQQLYEGVSLRGEGSVGLITYMRTDSVRVASSAIEETRDYIKDAYGAEYLPKQVRVFTKKSRGAQEAHEAIRPTSIRRTPNSVEKQLPRDMSRLYKLIWGRMVASQMAVALSDATTVDIEAQCSEAKKTYVFRTKGSVLKFPGFRILYLEGKDETDEDAENGDASLPPLEKEETLACLGLDPEQRFTQPPPRYTEATLIRALEENGIGRPSTYASILSTLLERDYITNERRRLVPSILGKTVCNQLKEFFPSIMDVDFTARMEEDLDRIAQGDAQWVPILSEFHGPFQKALEEAMEKMPRVRIEEPTDEICPECGKPLVIRRGRFGPFMACSGFPECRHTKPIVKETGVKCPKCEDGHLVERRGRKKGRVFYGCSNYPTCDFAVNRKPLSQKCPECDGLLIQTGRDGAQCTNCAYKGDIPEAEPQDAASKVTQ